MPEPLAWAIARNIGASLVAMPVTDDQACQPTQPTRLDRPPPAARQRRWSVAADAHQHLADVLAAHEADESGGGVLDTVDNRLGETNASLGQPAADLGEKRRPAVNMVANDEAAQREPVADHQTKITRPGRWLVGVVLRDRPAEGRASVQAQGANGRLQMLTANVVVVDVDAVRRLSLIHISEP